MKKTATVIALLAALGAAPVSGFAEGSMGIIGGADGPTEIIVPGGWVDDGTADIYYNSEYLTPGIIIDERTMLPFRDFLESIGAEVNYNEESRTVTAVRDETSVSFCIDEDIIHIKNAEGEKDIVMDVKPVVIDDTVYAPIRFLGEAFAMQIGWDEYNGAALVADYEKYIKEFFNSSPNFKKMIELSMAQPKEAVSDSDVNVSCKFYLPELSDDNTVTVNENVFDLSLKTKGAVHELDQDSDSVVSLTYKGADGTEVTLKDAELDIITVDNNFYIKTDVLDQLAELNEQIKMASELSSPDKWYKISLEDYMNIISSAVGGEAIDYETIKGLIDSSSDPWAMLEKQLKTQSLASIWDVDLTTQIFKALAAVDKYISINATGDNDYIISFKLDTAALLALSEEISGTELSQEEIDEFDNFVKYDIKLEQKIENGITVSQDISMDIGITEVFELKLEGLTSVREEKTNIEVPAEYVDLTEILGALF